MIILPLPTNTNNDPAKLVPDGVVLYHIKDKDKPSSSLR